MYNKICSACNNVFETNIKCKVYCNKDCKKLYYNNKKILYEYNNICNICGKSFISKSNKTKCCSDNCRKISADLINKQEKQCKFCGKNFITVSYSQIYCSKECGDLHYKNDNMFNNIKSGEYKKTCPTCGILFETNRERQIYCSKICKMEYKYNKVCPVCNKEFKTNNLYKIYCSRECRNEKYKRICPICEKKFKTYIRNKMYCSKKCSDIKYEKECPVCGKIFETGKSNKIYCSKECRDKNVCVWCNKVFIHSGSKKYCSDECKSESKKYKKQFRDQLSQTEIDIGNMTDDMILKFRDRYINTWYISGFNNGLKERILERDGYKCYICGKETNLHVHHIVPRDQGGPHVPENLVTLCGRCHMIIENNDEKSAIKKCIETVLNIN